MTSRPGFTPRYLSVQDAARLTRLSTKTVLRQIYAGELPAVKVGRQWRIRVDDYEVWTGQADTKETP